MQLASIVRYTHLTMSKTIQVRDVPDDVHDALAALAEARGLSLTRFLLGEFEHLARRPEVAAHNRTVIEEARARIGMTKATRETILEAIRSGRGD
jgi:hypothetical protein